MYIPSEEMGDYEHLRNKTKKKSSGVLFPLDEEGSYGAPPSQLPKPLPGYAKRERKPKVYASYAVSNDCSMHVAKLEKNEAASRSRMETPPRGRAPPQRKDSYPSRTKSSTPTRTKDPAPTPPASRTKWQNTLRDPGYSSSTPRWQDSLRGRDSTSPSTPRVTRRTSTLPRQPARRSSASVSPNRSRTISTSPERRRQSMSPVGTRGGGARSSADWGYTDFSTFTANMRSSEYSSATNERKSTVDRKFSTDRKSSTDRKFPAERKSSALSDGGEYAQRRSSGRDYNAGQDRKSSTKDYGGTVAGRNNSRSRDYSISSDYSASASYSRDYSSSSRDYTAAARTKEVNTSRSSSPSKIGLSSLKTPTISEWDQMGILGLSSKMFKESSNQKEGYTASSSFYRRESVTTKVM